MQQRRTQSEVMFAPHTSGIITSLSLLQDSALPLFVGLFQDDIRATADLFEYLGVALQLAKHVHRTGGTDVVTMTGWRPAEEDAERVSGGQ